MATKLREAKILRPLFALRDIIWEKTGLFDLKKKIKKKILIHRIEREDARFKRDIKNKILSLSNNVLDGNTSNSDVIISLTSYGKRVENSLPYALYSLLQQTILPSNIVVYLDWDNWSDNKLPKLLRHLQKLGVTIRYCEDIRSYKKIIPALQDFPNNFIITVDDDIYYDVHMIEWLLGAYKDLPEKSVVGLWARVVATKDDNYLPYNTWKDCKYKTSDSEFSLYTGYGTLYPPHIFDAEVMNSKIFLSLCPTADDIWMWVMEKRLNIPVYITKNAGLGLHTELNNKGFLYPEYDTDCLYYVNELTEKRNNKQLNELINYYNIHPTKK